jgi:ATP-dependent DNA helicase RecG
MDKGKQLELFEDVSFHEGVRVEYKGAKSDLPRSLWETYSAFANTEGGWIWLGITQRDNGILDKHGVRDPNKQLADLWSTLRSNKVSRNLLLEKDVEMVDVEGGTLIKLYVRRADRRERPVYIGLDPYRGTYRRNHEGDFLCDRDEVTRMFADQSDEEPADSRILEGFGLPDLDQASLKQYRNRLASRFPNDPWLLEDDKGLLTKLGGWRLDRRTGMDGLTVAGLLMFGKTEVITTPEAMPGFHLDYRERFSEDPNIRWTDRITSDGTWEGNLFQFYVRVMLRLSTGPGLTTPFRLGSEGVRQTTTAVHEALQEALVNALIHADHFGQGGVVIDRWTDRIECSNPGTLLLSREQLQKGGISECRNKFLQRMFQKLGIGDKAGSGLDKIRHSWMQQHWLSPQLGETYRPDRVKLVLPMVSMMPPEVLDGLFSRFGEKFNALRKEELQTLAAAAMSDHVTNHHLQQEVSLHRVDITNMLRELVQQGFLIAEGTGRGTRYKLFGGPLANSGVSSKHIDEQQVAGQHDNSGRRTGKLVLSSVKYRGRGRTEALKTAILSETKDRYRTVKELANVLNIGLSRMRQVIYEMSAAGQLVPRTSKPKAPNQAYIAAKRAYRTRSVGNSA